MVVTTKGDKVSLSTPTDWGDPVITKLSPSEAFGLAERIRNAATEAQAALTPKDWLKHKGHEWATDRAVIIRRGTPLPVGWAGPAPLTQEQFSEGFDRLVRATDEPHLGAFNAGYASLLALGRVVLSDTPQVSPDRLWWPAVVLDASGEVVAVVMPVKGAGNSDEAVRADGSPWRVGTNLDPTTKPGEACG